MVALKMVLRCRKVKFCGTAMPLTAKIWRFGAKSILSRLGKIWNALWK